YDDVARHDALRLDGLDRGRLGQKHFGRTGLTVNAVFVEHTGIDRRALDDRALPSKVSLWKTHRRRESSRRRQFGRHDDVVRIDTIALVQQPPEPRAARRGFPG